MKTSLLTMVALALVLVLAGFTLAYALFRLWLGLPILPELTFQGEDSSEAIASSLPSEDVAGEDIPGLPRYPDSVRTAYEREETGDLVETRVEYGATAPSLDAVREFYRDTFREEDWSVENAEFSEGRWTFLVTQDERDALVEFEMRAGSRGGLFDIRIELSEPLPDEMESDETESDETESASESTTTSTTAAPEPAPTALSPPSTPAGASASSNPAPAAPTPVAPIPATFPGPIPVPTPVPTPAAGPAPAPTPSLVPDTAPTPAPEFVPAPTPALEPAPVPAPSPAPAPAPVRGGGDDGGGGGGGGGDDDGGRGDGDDGRGGGDDGGGDDDGGRGGGDDDDGGGDD